MSEDRSERAPGALVLLAAVLVAALSAGPYAASFNDGSRLATVECLVDHGTLAIDDSVFTNPPPATCPGQPLPYHPAVPYLPEHGTADKLLIHGRFYSDKPPVPALVLAGLYRGLQVLTGLRARARPDLFSYAMTLGSCGLAYVVAVWCVFRLGAVLGLGRALRLGLTASFALATVAPAYARHVNGHILLLAVAAALLLALTAWGRHPLAPAGRWALLGCGLLAGLGYSIEQPTGGLLIPGALLLVVWRSGRLAAGVPLAVGVLPFSLLHHAVVYSYAGTLGPPGAAPEFFDYPGTAFTPEELTGFYRHPSAGHFLLYAGGLLLGDRGFLQANLPLFLAVPAAWLLRRPPHPSVGEGAGGWGVREWPEALLACLWAVGTWLVYALLSTNYSGVCCSVRWLVPLLAAGYYLLALLLRDRPETRLDFLVLSAWGAVLGALMWYGGTWGSDVPFFWPVQAAALATWLAVTRLLPGWLGRLLDRLPRLGWLAVAGCTVVPLLAERPPLALLGPADSDWARGGRAAVLLALAFVVGVRARADRRDGAWAPWLTLGFGLLAGGLTLVHWLVVDRQPHRLAWQRDLYLDLLNHAAGAPHQYRPLPYGFARLAELLAHDWLFACLAYRWSFTFWFVWSAFRLARLYLPPARALATLAPLVALYPLSILHYFGQLADPLSHTLFVLGTIYLLEDRPWPLATPGTVSVALGVLAKETAVLLVPVYLVCHLRSGPRAWLTTAGLGAGAVAAFLAARLPLRWWPGYEAINGTSGLMVGTNLGIGPPVVWTSVPLAENYLHPLLFVGPFVLALAWSWRSIDRTLRAACLTLTPLLLASNLCFGWMYESRNYMPLVPLLATAALAGRVSGGRKPPDSLANGGRKPPEG